MLTLGVSLHSEKKPKIVHAEKPHGEAVCSISACHPAVVSADSQHEPSGIRVWARMFQLIAVESLPDFNSLN